MQVFTHRPIPVKAAQYGVDTEFTELKNELEKRGARAYTGGKLQEEPVHRINAFVSGSKTVTVIKYGDWIVFHQGSKFEVLSETEFHKRFSKS